MDPKAFLTALAFKDNPEVGQALNARYTASQTPQGRSGGSGGGGGGAYFGNPGATGKDYTFLQRIGRNRFGLQNDPGNYQTTGGTHQPDSYHYTGHAVDFGSARNSPQQLQSWYDYLNANKANLGLAELIWEDRGGSNEHIHAALGR
jgi:hypothetical protein